MSKKRNDVIDEVLRLSVGQPLGRGTERIVSFGFIARAQLLLQVPECRLQVGRKIASHHLEEVVGIGVGEAFLKRAGMAGERASCREEDHG